MANDLVPNVTAVPETAAVPETSAVPGSIALAADLRIALMRSVRRLRAEKADAALTDAQYCVLALLERDGPATPGELAERERVQPPSMTRTLAGLAALGLVSRTAHPDDGRQVLVDVTDTARTTVRETRRQRDVWLAARLAELDDDDLAALVRATEVLRRIADS